jgi:eukaryotic-like serine/threonine-protein kinase
MVKKLLFVSRFIRCKLVLSMIIVIGCPSFDLLVIGESPSQKEKDSTFDRWVEEVRALSAEEQVTAVTEKLEDLNAAFDGEVKPKIEEGVVTHFQFSSNGVRDLSPLRALPGLKVLRCNGNGSPLKDLTPLIGMRLILLDCIDTSVSDLSPLKDMPLGTLNLRRTKVTDLSLLRGMPLTSLLFDDTFVTDLSPLHECKKLTRLNLMNTRVPLSAVLDLQKALPNCKISWSNPQNAQQQKPVEKSKAPYNETSLIEWKNQVAELEAEKQIEAVAEKLKELNPEFDGKIQPQIRNGTLSQLRLSSQNVSSLSPLWALSSLEFLNITANRGKVESLEPLQGMPLSILYLNGNPVSDLSPLEGMRLTFLGISRTKVSDLSPLAGMPLIFLNCDGTPITDLSPLQNCKKLITLSIVDTQVTSEGVASLQKALPNCKIKWR